MEFLFIGDSITRGNLGASFVNRFKQGCHRCKITNLGREGDTMESVLQRLIIHLANENKYDAIILQGGCNDILLPSFKQKGPTFRFAYRQKLKRGLKPAEHTSDFYDILKSYIKKIRDLYTGKIILLTMGCIGENPGTQLNRQRKSYNKIIRKIAEEENILLADTETKFDIANRRNKTSYCLHNFWAVTLTDRLVSFLLGGPDMLSRRRNLNLTIDGVHLNNTGAKIFSDSIKEILCD
jgi:lysophospholipase L1-like esterase